jgi:hypothetical protein
MTRQEILDLLQPVQVEHLKSSMNLIDQEGVPKGRSSQLYVVLDQERGKSYPPPLLLEIAYQLATGKQLPLGFFNMIKKDGPHFEKIKSLGYQVTDKVDPLLQLISDYKEHIRETKLSDELYKWELLGKFKGRPNLDAADFGEELRSVNYGNFLYAMSSGVLRGLAKHAPEEMRDIVRNLVDETKSLKDRIETYSKETFALYRRLEPENELNHHQDERTAATLLTFYAPDKYTLYKSSFYVKYCEFLGIKQRGKGEKYVHYLELVQQFVQEYIQNDKELIELVDSFLPTSAYRDTQHLILAQDILYHHFNKFNGSVDIFKTIQQFLDQAKTGDLKTAFYPKVYEGLTMKVSFGQGGPARVPWISFTKEPHTTSKGIYPVFLHYKEHNQLVLAYGISETEDSGYTWPNTDGLETITDWFQRTYNQRPDRYGASYIKGIYDTKDLDKELLENDLLELIQEYKGINESTKQKSEERPKQPIGMKLPLNQILYGPPGTGKTYSTIDKVIEICEPALFAVNDHKQNKELYDQLLKEGRVVFTTFHQSMSYEDFIEGIKPLKPGDEDAFLKYDVEPGLFKQIANTAKNLKTRTSTTIDWDNVDYYKMSIGGKNRPDIHNWCIENNVVGLSWGGEEDLSELVSKTNSQGWKKYRDDFKEMFPNTVEKNRYNIQASYILNKMKLGDIVVISKGNHVIDAIGKIVGEYYFDDQTPTDMFHFRKVEWIATDLDTSPEKFIDKQISQQSIYEFYDLDVKKEAFKGLTAIETTEEKPYVLVIDEINRGNVSAIFGELITLIEQDKRLGQENELKVTLPYSKDKFGVPSNLYILGTMNTADRSIEALDTALRRRFSFVEMMPNPELLKDKTVQGINLKDLLSKINQRIEALIDRDHTIGHAYLIDVENDKDLKRAFKDKIIPLLQEYFFGDYGKIGLVLGNGFVKKGEIKDSIFSEFEYEGREGLFQTTYELIPFDEVEFEEALKTLMK